MKSKKGLLALMTVLGIALLLTLGCSGGSSGEKTGATSTPTSVPAGSGVVPSSLESVARSAKPMKPEYRTEDSPLKPADDKLTERRISCIVSNKSSDVCGPPGNARHGHIQTILDLGLEGFEIRQNVPGPYTGPIELTSSPSGSAQAEG